MRSKICLAVVVTFLFVTGIGAQTKYVVSEAQDRNHAAFDGLGVADHYGWFAKYGGGEAGVGMRKEVGDLIYTIVHGKNGSAYYAARYDWDVKRDVPIGNSGKFYDVLNFVMTDADKQECSIQLGDPGYPVLDIDTSAIIIDGAKWGEVRLSGAFSSVFKTNSALTQAALVVSNGASVASSMNIVTSKTFAVQVNDSSKFTFNGEDAVSCGNIINTGTNGGKVTVTGGFVTYIDNEGEGWLEVIGGTVGSKSRKNYAIKNGERALAVISGSAEIVSADTNRSGGTILNGGELEISGGRVSNENSGFVSIAINNGYGEVGKFPTVTITGGEIISKVNGTVNPYFSTIINKRGEITISGGRIHNDEVLGGTIIANRGNLIISDSAKIDSKSFERGVYVIHNGLGDSANINLEIIGGKIIANRGAAINVYKYSNAFISGKAEISNNDTSNAVIFSAGESRLYLHGGTVKSLTANAVAIEIYEGGRGGRPGRLEMGGSPVVKGIIKSMGMTLWGVDDYSITFCNDNGYEFKPNGEIYRILSSEYNYNEDYVVLKNGAGFIHSFAADTTKNPDVEFAVKGNDVYATISRSNKVKFNLNGSTGGYIPKTIPVIPGGTIGELAKPETKGYVIFEKTNDTIYQIESDGEWYLNGSDDVFDFGVGKKGTPVNSDLTLTLSWTGPKTFFGVSVLESNRGLPAARPAETAVIAPISAAPVSLTAGPNPISRSLGAVNFFRSGVPLRGGKLFIYDASGNVVTTVAINDPSNSSGKRVVASWKINDANERQIANGTYAARGVITAKTGKAEMVSILINVQR